MALGVERLKILMIYLWLHGHEGCPFVLHQFVTLDSFKMCFHFQNVLSFSNDITTNNCAKVVLNHSEDELFQVQKGVYQVVKFNNSKK